MTWNDYYQRRDAITAVLEYARQNPSESITVDAVPQAHEVFPNTDELMSALHYKWMQTLTGRIAVALDEVEDQPRGDRLQAVADGWRKTSADNPVLRSILDRNAEHATGALKRAFEHEQRMLAHTAGLTEIGEDPAEAARVGSAFLGLLRSPAPTSCAQGTGVAGKLRGLLPSI